MESLAVAEAMGQNLKLSITIGINDSIFQAAVYAIKSAQISHLHRIWKERKSTINQIVKRP